MYLQIRVGIASLALLAMATERINAMPPVQTFGKISSTYRLNRPSDSADSSSLINTYEVGATSFIWQPWFGVWRANGAISRSDTKEEERTSADIFTGDIEVNLFHRSHFPFSAFVSIRDSRVDISSVREATSDLRTVRYGITQQYQDTRNRAFYLGSFERDEQSDFRNDNRAVSNRLLLSADKTGDVHSLNGVLTINQTTNSVADLRTQSNQGTISHNYRPSNHLTINNNAAISTVKSESDLFGGETRVFAAASQAEWRPEDDRLRVRGDIAGSREESTLDGRGSQTQDKLRGRGSARYELTDEAVLFGEIGFDRFVTDGEARLSTYQTVSATYNSKARDVLGFSYSWNAAAGIGNRTNTDEASAQSENANLGHTVTRTWLPDFDGPLPVVFSAGQEVRFTNESIEGAQTQIIHRATVSASKPDESGITYGQINAFDIRTFGRLENSIFSLNAAFSQNRAISRYASIDAAASYSFNSTSTEGLSQQRDVLSAEARYTNTRLFAIQRLSFESKLRLGASDLLVAGDGKQRIELEWDNRIGYRIGLLEVESRFGATQSRNDQNLIFMLTVTRRF